LFDVPARRAKGKEMQSLSWTPEHSAALREFVERGMSFANAAEAVNARFGTAYSRSAAIGRAKRMGLVVGVRPEDRLAMVPRMQKRPSAQENGTRRRSDQRGGVAESPPPLAERAEPVKLRCVGIQPRLLSLVELEDSDCRYPYGGDKDGDSIAFCGHPRCSGSSYCAPHFRLTRAPTIDVERAPGPFVLRLVDAA
jgi:GcrA cell cycle regulator